MKKLKMGLILFAVIAGIIFILFNNKTMLEVGEFTQVAEQS